MSLMVRLLFVFFAALLITEPAAAFPDFQKQFIKLYASEPGLDYTKLVKSAKCFVCHQGKSKKNRNAYGEALSEYIGKPDRKDVEKIVGALQTVADQSSDAETEGALTFGERIAEGKLPGGELEDLKANP